MATAVTSKAITRKSLEPTELGSIDARAKGTLSNAFLLATEWVGVLLGWVGERFLARAE